VVDKKSFYSLNELLASPSGRLFVEQTAIVSAEALAHFCEKEIYSIFRVMEENPQNHLNKSEDQITSYIVDMLKAKCILAEHDTMHGGHADIIVRHREFTWLAEAKIFEKGSYTWLLKGFLQLTTRYMAARDRHGAILIYTYRPDAAKMVTKWKSMLLSYKRIQHVSECSFCPLSFYTISQNKRSGLDIRVRHTVLGLYYKPEN